MRGIIFFLLLSILTSEVNAQSTTSNPQGYCASYLNRYTNENQCVYSFIVPKKDRDHCPGLEANLRTLQETISEMKARQTNTEDQIRILVKSDQNSRDLGAAEEKARILHERNNELEADKQRLIQEKADLQSQLNQKHVISNENYNQLAEIRSLYATIKGNYTRMKQVYEAQYQTLNLLQSKYDELKADYGELQQAKNCSDINKHLPSCAVIRQWGYTRSGHAMIDPDGEGGMDPFMVYCDMDSEDGSGITVIEHNIQEKTQVIGCEGAGCFSLEVSYNGASMGQISKLMDISLACSQYIRYDCYDSKLLKDGTAWWVSRDGNPQRHWGGAAPGSGKCACGMTNDCVSSSEVCNCDADREEWTYDEGNLQNKRTLPVSELFFGDVLHTAGEKGNVTLGELRCKWNVNMSVPSCEALSKAGVTDDGVYLIDPDGPRGPTAAIRTHCNLHASNVTHTQTPGNAPNPVIRPSNPNEYIFTDCNQLAGHEGPTEIMCNNTYVYSNVQVRVASGIQSWKVPKSGRYRIMAAAPSGYHETLSKAGRGARLWAEFKLKKDTEIKIIVGQRGERHAGSGGTSVIKMFEIYTARPLLIAGAGGSSLQKVKNTVHTDATQNQRGKDASTVGINYGHGGTDGNGGERGHNAGGPNTSGGGAGFKTDGSESGDTRFKDIFEPPTPAKAINGNNAPGRGGTYTYSDGMTYNGGFGGGGSGSKVAPGGAGGYSGGGGGPLDGSSGGGGCFQSPEAENYNILIDNTGLGRVTINYLGSVPGFDQPTS